MGPVRRRLVKAGVLAAASAGALVLAMPGAAIIRGTAVAPTPSWGPWAAYIVVSNNGSTTSCSGALVAPRRILTSAQCVAGTSLDGCAYAPQPYPAADFTVYVGNTTPTVNGTPYKVSS